MIEVRSVGFCLFRCCCINDGAWQAWVRARACAKARAYARTCLHTHARDGAHARHAQSFKPPTRKNQKPTLHNSIISQSSTTLGVDREKCFGGGNMPLVVWAPRLCGKERKEARNTDAKAPTDTLCHPRPSSQRRNKNKLASSR